MNKLHPIYDTFAAILIRAELKGLYLRRPWSFEEKPDTSLGYYCDQLDKLGVSFRAQNSVLYFYNNADDQDTWEKLKGRSYSATLTEALSFDKALLKELNAV